MSTEDIASALFRFFRALDERDYEQCAALFAPDGEWLRQGELVSGPPALHEALASRAPDLMTRHIVTNLVVEQSGDDAIVDFYGTVFAGHGPDGAPLASAPPAVVAAYHAELRRSDRGWLLRRLRSTPTFKG